VRHAIADTRDFARWPDDSRRPLTPEGAVRFRSAARGLRRIVPRVDLVLSSPFTRAWQTAEILEEEAGWPAPEPCEPLEADRSPASALDALSTLGSGSVALIGHEPCLSSLASLLAAGDGGTLNLELKKGGVAFLESPGDPAPGRALLRWSVSPKILRALEQR
jgi:phosphohistidine phosphatase